MATLGTIDYTFMEAAQISKIERDRDLQLAEDDVLSQIMPYNSQDGDAVTWDKDDDIGGLIPVKAAGALYPQGAVAGAKRFSVPASHWGMELEVPAKEIISRAKTGTVGDLMSIDDLLSQRHETLAVRQLQTLNLQRGQALALGVVNLYDKDENVVDTYNFDGFADRIVTLTGADKWDAPTTAAPLDMFAGMDADHFFGSGYSIAQGAILMNPITSKLFRQTAQFKAFRGQYGQQFVTIADYNQRFAGDYPRVIEVPGSALLRNGTVLPYLPDNYIVAVGAHQLRGIIAGNWTVTTNENSGEASVYAAGDRRPNNPKLPFAIRSIAGAPILKSWMKQIKVWKVK